MRTSFRLAGFARLLSILVISFASYAATAQVPGNALNFDGVNDYVTIADAASLKPATVTVEAWVRPITATGNIPIVLKLNSRGAGVSNNEAYSIYLNNGKFAAAASSSSGTQAKATQLATYDAGRWYHVAAMFTATSVSLYVNGVLQQTTATGFSLDHSTSTVTIGGTADFTTLANFSIDEFRVFKTDRTSQVASDMANTINPLSNPNLVAYYSFEQGTAGGSNTSLTTVTDRTSNANTGTLYGFDLTASTSNFVESYAMVIPSATAASSIGDAGFTANWNAPNFGTVTNYVLDVSTSASFSSFVSGYNGLSVAGTSQAVTGLTSGVTYYYRVRADKASVTGQGTYSITQSARTIFVLPSITYPSSTYTYTSGTVVSPISPTNTGGTVPASVYGQVTTLAGGNAGFQDGTGTASQFNSPYAMVSDGTNLYVADLGNHRIRKIVIATGVVTTLAGQGYNFFGDGTGSAAYFNAPRGLALDGAGNLYVADFNNHRIRKIVIATGVVSTIAGNGSSSTVDGNGTSASISSPTGIVYDAGNLYVTSLYNHRIRKIVLSTNDVTTLAGSGSGSFADGTGTAASFSSPSGIATDGLGNLYVADQSNNRIRKIVIATAVVTTIAGNGSSGSSNGIGTSASFYTPMDIVFDGADNLYVIEQSNHRIRKIVLSTTNVTSFNTANGSFTDGDLATATFNNPTGLAMDGNGYLYIADQGNHRIRQVGVVGYTISPALPAGLSFNGTTGTISGTPGISSVSTNYTITAYNNAGGNSTTINITVNPGQPSVSSFAPVSAGAGQTVIITGTNFASVTGVSFGGTPAISYVVLSETRIAAVVGAGTTGSVSVTTVLGSASLAGFTFLLPPSISFATPQSYPQGTAITALTPTNTGGAVPAVTYGTVSTLAGNGSASSSNGTGTGASFYNPQGVVSDGTNLYVADLNNHIIRKIVIATGVTTTLAGNAGYASQQDGIGTNAYFYNPHALALDGLGNLYVSQGNYSYSMIRKIVIATGAVTTLAGSSNAGSSDGTGTNAQFYNPHGITYDGSGNLYVADQAYGAIRKVTIATGAVTTILTGFNSPTGIAYDGGNLYITEQGNQRIRKVVISTNTVTTLAGNGSGAFADGTGTAASFYSPAGIVADGSGNLYVADQDNHRIRKIVIATGAVTTVAGNGSANFVDGVSTAASFYSPYGIAVDNNGYLYIGDHNNHRIRKLGLVGYSISPTTLPPGLAFDGTTGTIAGTPTIGFLAATYTVTGVNNVGMDTAVVSITIVPSTPTITSLSPVSVGPGQSITITGTNFSTVTAVSFGGTPAASYTVNSTTSITAILGAGADGSVSVTTTGGTATLAGFLVLTAPIISYATPQTYNQGTAITALTPTNTAGIIPPVNYGTVSTLAGSGSASSGNGTGTGASFYNPQGVVSDGTNIYVADYNNHTIRKIVIATGVTTTLAGSAGSASQQDGTGANAYFNYPRGLALDGAGNLYVTQGDYYNCGVRKIVISTGVVTTLAGGSYYPSSNDGTGTSAQFYNPTGIAYDGAGNLYVADQVYGNIRKIAIATGIVTTFSTGFGGPAGIAYDGGNLYVTERDNHRIRKIVISTNTVSTLAGSGSATFADGTGTAASFYSPNHITADGSGNLYVADQSNHRIRKIVIANGVVTTVAGNGTQTFVNGSSTTASFNSPNGVALDGAGYLYVGDQSNHRIRKIGLLGYSISPTALPAGLSFDGTTGAISGTPTIGTLAANFVVTGVNTIGLDTANISITVIPAAPTVTSVSPVSVGPGQSITITGTNFSTVTAVSFGGVAAASYTVNSTTSITAILGAGADGSVSVTTTGGTGTLAGFTMLTVPSISYATPQNYPVNTAITALLPTNAGGIIPAVSYGTVSTLAGSGTASSTNGTGTGASFNNPQGVVSDGTNIYVAEYNGHRIRKIVIATGVTTTLAGSGGASMNDGTGTGATFYFPHGLALDDQGNLYVAQGNNNYSAIRKIVIATGVVTTLAGNISSGNSDGTGNNAYFYNPTGIAYDGAGNLYVADQGYGYIRKVVIATGVVTTIATGLSAPTGIAYEGGNLYITERDYHRIIKLVISTNTITTLAGSSSATFADGTGTAASFYSPTGITADGSGNLYVADQSNYRIRKIVIATGVVTTLAGNGSQTFVDGASTAASFSNPYGITLDGGYLYVGDQNNYRIRRIGLVGYTVTPALPAGLSFASTTGTISGTPTIGSLPTNYVVTGVNSIGSDTANISIGIIPAAPTVTSFTPTSVGAGQSVTITGTNFVAVTGVSFGGTDVASFTINSSTSITAIVGAGATGSVSVTTTGGTATLAGFTLLLSPVISYTTPQNYPINTAITALAPTNTGGSVPAVNFGTVSTLAGSGSANSTNGTGTGASFYSPQGVVSDGTNIYIADFNNHRIRKIVIATGVTTTLAGGNGTGLTDATGTSAAFFYPRGLALDGLGNLYVCQGNSSYSAIRKIVISTGVVTTLAGGNGYGNSDGTGAAAVFYNPISITYDGAGNLYVADQAYGTIRKIVIATRLVTTLPVTLGTPMGIAYDNGNLYITEQSGQRIRKVVISTNTITTLAGSGSGAFADGTGTAASFSTPAGIVADGSGNLYVADQSNHRIRKIVIATAVVTTVAGNGTATFVDGSSTTASFYSPTGVALDAAGYLYVGDQNNHRIRKIGLVGYTITPALPTGLSFDGTTGTISGTPTIALLPTSYTVLANNSAGSGTATVTIAVVPAAPTITSFTPTSAPYVRNVTITGTNFATVTSVSFGGTAAISFTVNSTTSITAMVGTGATGDVTVTTTGGTATLAGFTFLLPPNIAYATPQTYASGTAITTLAPTNSGTAVPTGGYGIVSTLAGSTGGFQNGTGTSAYFSSPQGVVSDGTNVYVADYSNHRIRQIVIATGVTTTLAGSGGGGMGNGTGISTTFYYPRGLALDGQGNLYVAQGNYDYSSIRKIVISTGVVTTLAGNGNAGNNDGTGTNAYFYNPAAITYDGSGNLYVADQAYGNIRKIVIATGVVTTVSTGYNSPMGIAYDNGNLYITEQGNHRIKKFVISTNTATVFAGTGTGAFADGTGTAASFYSPAGITADGLGNLYVSDFNNHRIRKIAIGTAGVTTIAGNGTATFVDGSSATASFSSPFGITVDAAGYLYIGDQANQRIRKIGLHGYSISPALPTGLSFSTSTGEISGTPTVGSLATDYTVNAYNSNGIDTTTVNITVTANAPTIASFTPTTAGAGQTVIITGTNFSAISAVSFGGTAVASFNVVSTTTIIAVVGAGTSGSVSITNNGGTATLAGFAFLPLPSIAYAGPQSYTAGTAITALAPTNTGGAVPAVNYGTVSTLAGSTGGFQNGTSTSAYFNSPQGVASDGTNIYVADYNNHVIRKIVIATGVTTTLAGNNNNASLQDGTGSNAYFYYPRSIVYDGLGNLYVTQGNYGNSAIRKIVIATSVVTTLAGNNGYSYQDGTGSNAYFHNPTGITYDGLGNLYVTDQLNHRIRKIVISSGVVTTLAGSSQSYLDGTGTSAYFNNPTGIAYDGGNLYVADQGNSRIRKVVISTGVVTTLAGSSQSYQDGIGTSAYFSGPTGIVVDGNGNLYITDQYNHRIRKIVISTGVVTTLAGNGSSTFVDGSSTTSSFYSPYGVAVDGAGYLYIGDQNNHRIRKIGLVGYSMNPALPTGLSFDGTTGTISGTPTTGTLAANYTVTAANNAGTNTATINIAVLPQTPTITSFTPTSVGTGQTIAITGTNFVTVTGVSFGGTAAASYTVNSATSITAILGAGANGNVSVTTTGGTATLAGFVVLVAPSISYATPQSYPVGTAITTLSPTNTGGVVSASSTPNVGTLAGNSGGFQNGTGTNAYFNNPQGMVSDGTNLYVADWYNHRIRQIVLATGVTTTLAGNSSAGMTNSTGTSATFYYPRGLALDGQGNLYVSQGEYGNSGIRKIVLATGAVTTLAGNTGSGNQDGTGSNAYFSTPGSITYDGQGNLYVADQPNNNIRKIVIATGVVTTVATGFSNPMGIAYDGGNLYVTEQGNNRIRKIVISTNTITTLAGSGGGGFADGTGTAASFYSPIGITADGSGNLFVADFNNNRIRKIVISTGVVTTFAGNGSGGSTDGIATTTATFSNPAGIAMGANGYLYVSDQSSSRIRKIDMFGYFINPTLPTGLSFDGTTGAISGTPTVGTLPSSYTVTAANSIGSNTTTLSIATVPETPTITSFTPTSAGAGQTVTITGANFATVTGVSFGGTAVASFTVNSTTSITAVVGAGTTGSVSVATTGGTATLAGFTLLLPPVFTYAGPQTYNGGTAITALVPTNTGGTVPAVNYGAVTTLAGSNGGFQNGTGTSAYFNNPQGVVSDGTNIYVADYNNHIIRQIVIATGVTTTLAGSVGNANQQDGTGANAYFYNPHSLALDGQGNLYVSQSDYYYCGIRKIVIATGVVTTLAGGNYYPSSGDGTGTSAQFYNPSGITYDGAGNLYVADRSNGSIRKVVVATGVVTTLVSGLSNPTGIAYDGGNLYVTEQNNQRIRKIVISTNTVTTLAGSGGASFADGTGTAASFYNPAGIAADGSGNLYVADFNNHRIRKIVISTGVVTTLAGNGTAAFVDGSLATASLYGPYGITLDGSGYLYVGDQYNNRIRKIGLVGYSITPALPSGLSFEGTTGTISGTPTTGSLATTYTVTGVNGVGAGTATVNITVIPETPTVTAFAPTSAGAGQMVAITGTNFTTVTGVSFGGTAVASFTVNSSTSITALLGAGATGSASVTTTGGTATLAGFTFLLPPAITYTTPQVYTTNSAITALVPTNTGGAVPAVNYGTVSTLAGSNGGFQNGTGTSANFNTPRGVVSDGTNIYVADYNNHIIRKIVIASGVTTTLAGSAGSASNQDGTGTNAYFNYPIGLALDGQGNLYVSQGDYYYCGIRKIVIATGVVTTLAGGNYYPSSGDGTGTSAQFYNPSGITYDGAGNLYVADRSNGSIRKVVVATGVVTTVASSFSSPTGIAYDGGNLYVTEQNNQRIRKIVISTNSVTTLAGSGGASFADGTGTAASFYNPAGIAADGSGNLYVADQNNHRIRKIAIGTGVVTTVAGNGSATFVDGTSTTASFYNPYGVAVDNTGYLYVGDQNNQRIRKIGVVGYSINNTLPTGLSFDGTTGTISGTPTVVTPAANYTVTAANNVGTVTTTVNISVVLPLPTITSFTPSTVGAGQTVIITGTGFTGASSVTFGGTPATYTVISGTSIKAVLGAGSSGSVVVITPGGTATLAGFTLMSAPSITYAGPQSYLTGAAITSLSPTNSGGTVPAATYGTTTTLAGSNNGSADGTGTSASFSRPYGVTTDGAGNLYVADYYNHKIRKIVIATGVVTTVAGSGTDAFANGTAAAASFNYPAGIVADKIGNLYVADQLNNRIRKIVLATGAVTTFAGSGTDAFADGSSSSANFSSPVGITTDGTNLYVADANNNRIRKIVISTGAVTTLAGSGNANFANGTGIVASFSNPSGITYDGVGSLFVADQYNNRIRKIIISSGVVTTLAGNGNANVTDGVGTAAAFDNPVDISSDGIGNVYVTDQNNNRIRKVNTATGVVTTVAGSSTGTTDATGTAAKFNSPAGIVADNAGKLYVGDLGNDRIRAITVTGYNLNTALPTGLAMNGETGVISGTPTVETAAANYSITSSNAAGISTATVNIAVVAEPSISSFAPTSAAIAQTVTITGTNFTGVTSVTFGGTAAASFTVVSPTSITAVVAAGTSGSVSVVKAGITASLAGFTFLQPTASISGTTSVCVNGTTPSIIFTGAFGAAPYTFTYTINNGSNLTATTTSGSTVTVAAPTGTAGTFTYNLVSVADNASNSQTQTGSATVTVNALPTITTQAITPICGALTADLNTGITSDTTGLTIAYYSNAGLTTTVANPVSASGTYYIKVITSTNCTASAAVVVNAFKPVPGTPTISVTQPTCSTATATVSVTSTLTGLTFSNDGTTYTNTTGVFTVAAGSSYSITAKNSDGCISAAVTGTVNAQPVTPATPLVNITQPTCSTATGTITVTSTGASTFALVIEGTTFSNPTGVFNNITAGSAYSVTTTSAAGCTSPATNGTVNAQPSTPTVPTVSVTQPTCTTATATINVTSTLTGFTFSNDGTTYTNTTGVFTVAAGSSYSITAKNAAGCISVAAAGTVNTQPATPTVPTVSVTQPTCSTATATISVTSTLTGLTFSNDGTTYTNTTGVFTVAAGSSYSITAKNAAGCISTGVTGTVNAQPVSPSSPTVSVTQPTCSTATATVTITSSLTGLTFSKDGTDYTNTTGVFTGIAAGSAYSITAKNTTGCISVAATGTINAQPTAPATPVVSIVQPTCSTATASVTVTSSLTGLTFSNDGTTYTNTTGVFTVAAGSSYSITAKNAAGCISSAATGTINAQPATPAIPVVSITQPTCTTATAGITVTSAGASSFTLVSDGTTFINSTGVFNNLAAGSTYSVTTASSAGCVSTATTGTINAQPAAPTVPTISVTQPTCSVATATITVTSTTTGLTFSNDGTTYTNTTGVFNNIAAGSSYGVTARNTNGCISTAATGTIIAQPNAPFTPVVSVTQPTCTTATATVTVISGTTGLTFSNDGATYTNTTGVFTAAAGSSYSITSKTSAGCISLAATGTVNAQPTVPTVAAITGTTTVCAGSATTLSSTTTGGVWTSNTISIATINSSTGEVNSVSGGTTTITYTVSNGTCSNSAATTVTVNSYPVVAAIANNNALCIGSTNTLTNTTNAGTWNSNTTSVATINSSTGLVTAIAAGSSTITYTVSNGTCSTTSNATVVVNPNGSWTGTSNTVWTDANNWCNGVPTASSDATILATATNMPVLTGSQSVRNITVQSGASMTVTGTLQVAGNISNNGTFTASAGTIELNGSSLQTVALGATVKNVNINSTGGVVLANSMSISGTFNSIAGNVDLNNYNITLLSTVTATARIAPVTGTFTYGTGKFVLQRFVPAKPARTWSMVASPFNQTISASWQQQVHITGAGTGGGNCPSLLPHTNGFDATGSNAASMFIYDGSKLTGTRWASVAGTNTVNLVAGTGYRMNVRGPRSMGCSLLDGTVLSTSDAIMASAGTLSNGDKNMGSFSITYSNNGNATASNDNFLMIGNPYPSEVSFAQLKADNSSAIGSSYAIYGPQNTVGNYAYWNGSTFTGGNTGLDDTKGDVIANGQAIFVKGAVPGANITLAFNEAQKTNIANNGYFRTQANPNMLRIGYMINNGNKADEIILQFANGGTTDQLNNEDIVSMNTGSQNLKSIKGTREMAINTRPLNFINDTVSLNVASSSNGTFRLQFSGYAGFTGANIYLIDKYTNSIQYMNSNPDYYFTVNTSDSLSKGANRFKVVFSKQAPVAPMVAVPDPIKVYPNPVRNMLNIQLPQVAGMYTLRLMDVRGRLVTEQKAVQGANTMNTASLITGVYMLEVTNANGKKEVIKIIKE
jgi:hypothetical protein